MNSEWIHSNKLPFVLDNYFDVWTKNDQVRKVTRYYGDLIFTDCRDPMQNCHCDESYILAYRWVEIDE